MKWILLTLKMSEEQECTTAVVFWLSSPFQQQINDCEGEARIQTQNSYPDKLMLQPSILPGLFCQTFPFLIDSNNASWPVRSF